MPRVVVLALLVCACGGRDTTSEPGWTQLSPNLAGDLSQIASTATDVWVLGTTDFNARANVIGRWDGAAWTELADTGFFYLTAAGGTDIWLAGQAGKLARWDGTAFVPVASGVTASIGPLWGGAGDDVWIVDATSPSLLHWDGTGVTPVAVGAAPIRGVSGTARDDVWAVGAAIYHFDGASWTSVPAPNAGALSSVTAITRDLAWAQSATEILRWDGATWSIEPGIPATARVAGRARDDVWAYNASAPVGLRHWDGSTWSADVPPTIPISQIGVDASGILWGVGGYDRVVRRDACGWSFVSGAIHHSESISGMWAAGSVIRMIGSPYGDLYGLDDCGITRVTAVANDATHAIGGTAADDLWLVGAYGYIEHWDGAKVTAPTQPTGATLPTLHGVWASAPDDAWAVGEQGRISHWDGQAWTDVASPTTSWLTAVWGSSATDVWAVGELGTIVHWDGSAWTLDDAGTRAWLGSVWSIGSEAWAVGEAGTIVYRSGRRWAPVPSGTSATLMEIRGRSREDVWAVGERGTVLRYQAAAWHAVPTTTEATLTALGLGDVTWVGGAGALVMYR